MKKGTSMDIDWRTVQFFLYNEGVCEVQIDSENSKKVRCTCKSFLSNARCKHTLYVKTIMEKHDGNYSIKIPEEVPDEEAHLALANSEDFRNFIIKYGKIEVI